jgi:hypothetical protein
METYLSEDSPSMLVLEGILDHAGLRNILFALEHLCLAKAKHLSENWQDEKSAKVWATRARLCGATACRVPDRVRPYYRRRCKVA